MSRRGDVLSLEWRLDAPISERVARPQRMVSPLHFPARMANRRIHKKWAARRSAELERLDGVTQSIYAPRTCVVNIPCPACARGCLTRTYIPALGSMNGSVECPKCEYKDTFMATLAENMIGDDPLPPVLVNSYARPRSVPTEQELEITIAPSADEPLRAHAIFHARRFARRMSELYKILRALWLATKRPAVAFNYVERRAARTPAY